MKTSLRSAKIDDLDVLVYIDLLNEGYTSNSEEVATTEEIKKDRNKIENFIVHQDKGTLILEEIESQKCIGMIMYRINNRDKSYPWKTAFSEIDRTLFQEDGRLLEIFNLWIDSDYRRQGLAPYLKLKLEEEAVKHKVNLIYTHTEEHNDHVIELNKKLGYEEVRRGPIWDRIVRISLVKRLK